MKNVSYISVELPDMARPKERPEKSNWKIEMIKKGLKALQYASPRKVAEVMIHYFTMPGKVYFSSAQSGILEEATKDSFEYKGDKIVTYQWGQDGPSILLCHGWRSKAADFRKMILAYRELGYVVHAMDCRAHGNSGGKHSALPEFRDIVIEMILRSGSFDVIIGYSMGGIAAGMAISELDDYLKPKKLFLISAPPYVQYFFSNAVRNSGLNTSVYNEIVDMVEEIYGQPLDYFNLCLKSKKLASIDKYLIYCEDDDVVPFRGGMELFESQENAHFVQASGFGHYKIITHDFIIKYLIEHSEPKVQESTIA